MENIGYINCYKDFQANSGSFIEIKGKQIFFRMQKNVKNIPRVSNQQLKEELVF